MTGPNPDYTVPNLDQNEADVEANIEFTDFLDAKAAEFQVVQIVSGKTAVVKLTAYDETTDAASASGTNFVDELNNDVIVPITSVEVIDSDGGGEINVIDNGDGTFTIEGVETGNLIRYFTEDDHNRILIENAGDGKGQDSADFDIGGFKLIQANTATQEVGSTVHWEDDGPAITVEVVAAADMLMVDETDLSVDASGLVTLDQQRAVEHPDITEPQIGLWSETVGADEPGSLTISASSTFDMVTPDGIASTGTVAFDSTSGTGTLTTDFDNDPLNGDETIGFSLATNSDGTYEFTLDEVIVPVVTLSTDEGQLPAGGPDPVQTLTFGQNSETTDFVFFAVDADTATSGGIFSPTNIVPAIALGEPDLTEADLEAGAAPPIGNNTFPFIREEIEMNVSTTGIGVGNNVFQGFDPTGGTLGEINPFDPATLPEFDESFVINPEPLASSVKVFISKTAGGFNTPGSGATPAKTDYLYWISDVNLTDADGDSVNNSFAVNLFGAESTTDPSDFDVLLSGEAIGSSPESFNALDQAAPVNEYLIGQFDITEDILVLNSLAGGVGSYSLQTGLDLGVGASGANDSLVTSNNGPLSVTIADALLTPDRIIG